MQGFFVLGRNPDTEDGGLRLLPLEPLRHPKCDGAHTKAEVFLRVGLDDRVLHGENVANTDGIRSADVELKPLDGGEWSLWPQPHVCSGRSRSHNKSEYA